MLKWGSFMAVAEELTPMLNEVELLSHFLVRQAL